MKKIPFLISILFVVCIASNAVAQRGDKSDEIQAPLPADLIIPPSPVLLAEEALKTLQVAPGYRIEIAAADPLLGDPVAMAFGPDGRIWVVEMRGFMPNADGKGEDAKVGTVAVLEDTDHDGRMDKRTVFIDGLVMPRALALVGDGVLVAEPPFLWFCRDTDGDGVADEKIQIASDYGSTNNPEHTANGLYRAIDNWIYSANHNIRYRYLGAGKFERDLTFFRGQWGISQDNTGRLFHNSNSDPIRYDLVPSHYFARNPGLTDPAGVNSKLVPADLRIWPLRVTPGVNRGYKTLDKTGRLTAVTAACGPLVYRGDSLTELRNDVFVCEPAGNLIMRIDLIPQDDTLVGRNVTEGSEFLASTDERFRPVNLADGPDGGLYLVDMYRGIVQHRLYITTFLRRQIDERGLAEGRAMGRIYRIVPAQTGRARPEPFNLLNESTAQLITRLSSPNGWWRDTAQRVLVERRDPAAVELLRQLALNLSTPTLARLHALWTLEGVDGLDRPTLLAALSDPEANVCAAAIRLSENLLTANDTEVFKQVVAAMSETTAAIPYEVVLQQCLSLGESHDPRALPVLLDLARRHGSRPVIADAIVSGLRGREVEFIALAFAHPEPAFSQATVTLAATCVWRSDTASHATSLDQLFGAARTPGWSVKCLLDSLNNIMPAQRNRPQRIDPQRTVRIAAPPTTLTRYTSLDSSVGTRAAEVLARLSWPGHENMDTKKVVPLTATQEQLFEKGRIIFTMICAGCHQPTGRGLAGLAPSLVDSTWVAGDERALARIVLQGKTTDNFIMPQLQALDDESLAGALTFIRRSWGHGFDPVESATIAQARTETPGRVEPWNDQELTQFLESSMVARKSE